VVLEHVLDHRNDRRGCEASCVDLADPLDPARGSELEEQEIPAAEGGRGIADDEGFQLGNFHRRRRSL